MGISKEDMKTLVKAQRGEMDAVLMYKRLAKKVKDAGDREAFVRLAGDEKRHADVFHEYTKGRVLPNPAKAIFIPLMYRLVGRKKLYPLIAKAEYKAADKYKHIIDRYPEVEQVMNDEVFHGDAVLGLLEK